MLTALLSDIHGNTEALTACLRHAEEQGAERFVFLGDLVGYGADPAGVIAIVRDHVARGAIAVRGNHDDAVEVGPKHMDDASAEVIEWTRKTLSEADRAFLASLPMMVRDERRCLVHASPVRPEKWEYVDGVDAAIQGITAANATYTFCGHVHDQKLYFASGTGKAGQFAPTVASPIPIGRHRRWLAVVGSVGQPRDGNPAAAYTLFDDARERITFHRVAYDMPAAARRIRDAGLPVVFALRLERAR